MLGETFYISGHGFARCPGCARHVLLDDTVADTRCPFCDCGILDPPAPRLSRMASLEALGGAIGAIAGELRRAGGAPPAAVPTRDPGMNGDPGALHRMATAPDRPAHGLRHAVWEVTLACDLGCTHCGSRAGAARRDELTTSECFDLIDQLAEVGVREVTLIGGEAYLRPDWTQLVKHIVDAGMLCTMTTGARELTEERVDAAAAAGLASVGISIDGLSATHDALRGARGSWQAALESARRVTASAIRLTVNSQVNALSAPELPAMARLLAEIGAEAWQLQLTVPMGRAADRPRLLLQPFELLQLSTLLVWIREHLLDANGIVLIPGNNVGYFSPFEEHLRYGGDIGAHWTSCGAGREVLGIEADGSIKGCPSLPSEAYIGGSIRDTPLCTIVEQRPELTYLRGRTRQDLWGYCHDCYYADLCLAGCSWTSHSVMGRPGNNPYCNHRATMRAAEGYAERVVQVEAASGVPFDSGRFEIREEPISAHLRGGELFGMPLTEVLFARSDQQSVRPTSTFATYLALNRQPAARPVRLQMAGGVR